MAAPAALNVLCPRNELGERRCREGRRLVRYPTPTRPSLPCQAPVRPNSESSCLAIDTDCRNWTYRVERALCVQAAIPASKIALVEGEEQLRVIIQRVVIPAPNTNCANNPQCPWWQLRGCGPSAQYSAIIFCSSVSRALKSTSSCGLALKSLRPPPVPGRGGSRPHETAAPKYRERTTFPQKAPTNCCGHEVSGAVHVLERLPAIRVNDGGRVHWHCARGFTGVYPV